LFSLFFQGKNKTFFLILNSLQTISPELYFWGEAPNLKEALNLSFDLQVASEILGIFG